MAVLITGGAGFIGSHTCVSLLTAGKDVVVLDNFSNSSPDVIEKIKNITWEDFSVYSCDIRSENDVMRIFEEKCIEAVIHFAGLKAVGESVKNPLDYYDVNIGGTLSLLKAMKKSGCKKLVFSSSATVYGGNNPVPYREDFPTGATNPYGQTKLMIEKILTDYSAANSDFTAILLRYFNPIGSHESGLLCENPNGIPNNLFPYIVKVAKGELPKLNVFGNDYPTHDGTGVRDYIHVCDLANGHIAALNYAESHTGAEIFNLGTGKGTSVLELISEFEQVNKMKVPYEITERRSGDIAECYADVSKAEKILGWKAEKTISDMVEIH